MLYEVITKPDLFERLRPAFERFVRALYRRRLAVVLGFFAAAGGIFAAIPFIRQDLFSAEDRITSYNVCYTKLLRVLLDDPLDSRFALMRAHLLVERGEYKQAAPLLDAYASINPDDRLYILLRARMAMESSKDRSQAATALRRGLARYPDDPDLTLYAAEVFAVGDQAERAEAAALAKKAYAADPSSTRALKLLLGFDLAAGDYAAAAAKRNNFV